MYCSTDLTGEFRSFTFVREIATGGQGTVFIANLHGAAVAVKALILHSEMNEAERCKHVSYLEDAMRTIKSLRHRNIVQHFHTAYTGTLLPVGVPRYYITMELCHVSLARKARRAPINGRHFQKWAKDILSGLSYLHDNRILHRDLKGDNIFLSTGDRDTCVLKIGDLGDIKHLTNSFQPVSDNHGTCAFMAPEIIRGAISSRFSVVHKSDIWSFGCVLIEMLTGEQPQFVNRKHGGAPLRFTGRGCEMMIIFYVGNGGRPEISDTWPESVRCVINSCLNSDPQLRPSTTQLLDSDLVKGSPPVWDRTTSQQSHGTTIPNKLNSLYYPEKEVDPVVARQKSVQSNQLVSTVERFSPSATDIENGKTSTNMNFNGNKRKPNSKRITKQDIGMPTNFQHTQHVTWDPKKGFDYDDNDPTLRELCGKASISMKNPESATRAIFCGYLEKELRQLNATITPQPVVNGAAVPPAPLLYHSKATASVKPSRPAPPPPPPPLEPPTAVKLLTPSLAPRAEPAAGTVIRAPLPPINELLINDAIGSTETIGIGSEDCTKSQLSGSFRHLSVVNSHSNFDRKSDILTDPQLFPRAATDSEPAEGCETRSKGSTVPNATASIKERQFASVSRSFDTATSREESADTFQNDRKEATVNELLLRTAADAQTVDTSEVDSIYDCIDWELNSAEENVIWI